MIAAERQRQIEAEGWTPEHDDDHSDGELLLAAGSYASYALGLEYHGRNFDDALWRVRWPWSIDWWKPSDDPIRNLVKAGALIAAEIDRLQRRTPKEERK
jgi:hypothetical protein